MSVPEPLILHTLTAPEATEDQSPTHDPRSFDEYIGQTVLKEKLKTYTRAAEIRQEPLDHVLLFGPPGLGKTTLAYIIAHSMGVSLKVCSGPLLEKTGDLVALLSALQPRDVLFIDEIHRMAISVEEVLYSAMERFTVDVIIGQGAGARSINLPISPFTLIGATTRTGMLSAPLQSRFGIIERLDYYTDNELQEIILQSAEHINILLDRAAALALARAARGTPRIAKKLLRRMRDYAQVELCKKITEPFVHKILLILGIDRDGLTQHDWRLLQVILQQCQGGPVGLETLGALLGDDTQTIELVYEPFLMRKGYLEKTPRGRQIPRTAHAAIAARLGVSYQTGII